MIKKLLSTVTFIEAKQRFLPMGPLLMGYAPTCEPQKVIQAVQQGINVLYWFSLALVNNNGIPAVIPNSVQPLPDLDCIANITATLIELELETTHLVSIGGWGAQHPTTDFTAETMYATLKNWNENVVARPGLPFGFDGFDWDIEGANDPSDPNNIVTQQVLDLTGQISQLAKADGYIMSFVPPESYLDPTTTAYDRSLLHSYPEWESQVDFKYHGWNSLASLLAKYGTTIVDGMIEDTFDLVLIGLYETYSHADYNITAAPVKQSATDYLKKWIPTVYKGWWVDFSSDPGSGIESQIVKVKQTTFCVGLANGWAGSRGSILIMPNEAGQAYQDLKDVGLEPRGFFFWSIHEEGQVPKGQTEPLYMSAGLNQYLQVRNNDVQLS